MRLYEITDGFMKLLDKQDELSEEEVKQISSELQAALKNKSNNIVGYYKDRTAFIEAIDTEIKRLQDYKKAISNQVDSYKEYVKSNMEVLGLEKIETPVGKISIAKSPISVEILDENEVPAEFVEVVTTNKVDKKAISEHFKETGEIVPGVKINSNNTNLRIS